MENWAKSQYHNMKITQIINDSFKLQQYYDAIDCSIMIIPQLTKNIVKDLIEGKTDCLICKELIDNIEDVWHCNTCWKIIHLNCITNWVIKENQNIRRAYNYLAWKCPHCNTNYVEDDISNLMINCYCSKNYIYEDTDSKPSYKIPHACEGLCSKEICNHIKSCPLPCHPGPHVQCKEGKDIICFCGQTTRHFPCSVTHSSFCCDLICNKELPCKKHKCNTKCHKDSCISLFMNGKCEDCINELKEDLYAFLKQKEGIENIDLNINLPFILTDCIFNGQLPCNRHLSNLNTEHIQLQLQRLIKNNSINLGQLLSIFIPLCKVQVLNSCDCKKKSKYTSCYLLNYNEGLLNLLNIKKEDKIPQCNNICNSFLHCRNHRCKRRCCELYQVYITNYSVQDMKGYHICRLKCGKLLKCKHYCEENCHPGKCPQCPIKIHTRNLICNCGKTIVNPPFACSFQINCKMICEKDLPCGHLCPVQCHEGNCPPCLKTSIHKCFCGNKVTENAKCSELNELLNCQNKCDKMLNCGVHFCSIICHNHDEKYDQDYKCELKCLRNLLTCNHSCQMKCHGEFPCDENACKFIRTIYCKCGIMEETVPCYQAKQMTNELPCGNECVKVDLLYKVKKSFEGIDDLTAEKIFILYPNLKINETEAPVEEIPLKYYNQTLNYAKNKIKLIIRIENLFNELCKNPKPLSTSITLLKSDIDPIIDWLVIYHRLKIKKKNTVITINNIPEYFKQRYRLSLIALLFKHNLFYTVHQTLKKCKVYHPFAYTIIILTHKQYEAVEHTITISGVVNRNDYYLQETKEREFSIHFFSVQTGKRLFDLFKTKSLEFPECYELEYNSNEEDEIHLEDYLVKSNYYNYLNEGYDENYYQQNHKKEEEKNCVDEDGFIIVKKKKKAN